MKKEVFSTIAGLPGIPALRKRIAFSLGNVNKVFFGAAVKASDVWWYANIKRNSGGGDLY